MDVTKNPPKWEQMDADLDEETKDELVYEGGAVLQGMNYICSATKDNKELQQLYLDAAALMFSTDPRNWTFHFYLHMIISLIFTFVYKYSLKNPSGFLRNNT